MRQGNNTRFEHPEGKPAHEPTSTAVLGRCSVVGGMRGKRPRWLDVVHRSGRGGRREFDQHGHQRHWRSDLGSRGRKRRRGIGRGVTTSSTSSNTTSTTTSGGATVSPGALLWAKRAGGSGYEYGYGIAALGDGSALVTGAFSDTPTFGAGEPGETTLTSSGYNDIFVAKYAP